ncbi:MAG: DUF2750 domain-containing protein [Nocardioidaceae bacterium]
MTLSAAHFSAFFAEVERSAQVWTIRDKGGHPAPESNEARAMPFWSTRKRAQRIVDEVAAYRGFDIMAVPLDHWRERWLPGLQRDGLLLGLNWSGDRATGYDVDPADVLARLSGQD